MSQETLKSFVQLHDDYAFFERHVNETEATLAAWLPQVQGRWKSLRALDFGAGSGSFTQQFLKQADFAADQFQLTLVEPDSGFRAQALQTLAPFSTRPLEAWPLLDRDIAPSFDLIFSHHVLYYVPDLERTLRRLCGALLPGGRMLLVQGGHGNGMNKIVFAAFDLLADRSPYHYSEHTEAVLRELKVPLTIGEVHSVLDFPDSAEGRLRILRFLLSEHLARLPDGDQALSLFDPFVRGDRVRIESADQLFVVDAPR